MDRLDLKRDARQGEGGGNGIITRVVRLTVIDNKVNSIFSKL